MSFPTFPRLAALGASLLLVLVSPATLMAADTEPFNLQPLFTVDRSARYSVWTRRESVVEMDFGGRSRQFKRDTTVEGEITWTVKKVNADGSAQCVMVIDWLSATVINPDGRTVVADSRKSSSDSPPLHEAVRALSNTPITFDLAANAVIKKVDGLRDVQRKLKDLPKDAFTDADLMETAYDLAILGSAPSAASPGATWTHDMDRTHEVGTFHVQMKYELAGTELIEGQMIANVRGDGRLRFEAGADARQANVDVSLRDAESQEQVMWDLNRHEVVGRNESRRYTLSMKIPIGDRGTARQTMTDSVQNQSLRIAEKAD